MGFAEISEMPFAAIEAYLAHLPARIAETQLAMSDVISLPHLKKSERQNVLEMWRRTADVKQKPKPITPGVLRMFGIGVKHG